MRKLAANDKRLIWGGAVSLEYGDGWIKPWRLPYDEFDLFPGLQVMASFPAGVRVRFATDSTEIIFNTEPAEDLTGGVKNLPNLKVDLCIDGKLHKSLPFKIGDVEFRFSDLPARMKTVELWLYPMVPFKLRSIEFPDNAVIEKREDNRPRWIVWGSSITHCVGATSPSQSWPSIVAREKNLNLTCLGFGGQCHGEPMVARLIRSLPADLISVKLGINIHGLGSLSRRTFHPVVLGIIANIRDGHPNTPLVMCSPIFCQPRESEPSSSGISLEMMREDIQKAVESFRKRGDKNIHYLNGLDLIGPIQQKHLPDNVHPDGEGYKILGHNFIHAVFDKLMINTGVHSKASH